MKCKCRAKPKPDITWFRTNNVIKESSKISLKCTDVQEDIYEITLELKVRDNIDSVTLVSLQIYLRGGSRTSLFYLLNLKNNLLDFDTIF